MTKLVATRISDEKYSKILEKRSGLGCSVYDYLKMLVELDVGDTKETKKPEPHRKSDTDVELDRKYKEIVARIEAVGSTQ